MRVGVDVSTSPATFPESVGGGYRFEQDLLEGLLERMPDSRHEFVLLGVHPKWPRPLSRNCSYVDVSPGHSLPERAKRTANKLAHETRSTLQQVRRGKLERVVSSHLNEALRAARLDALVHLRPWVLSMEVPYCVFVWDLEHRCQPYFPELTNHGEWERREQRFGEMLQRATAVMTGTVVGKEQIERFYQVDPSRIVLLPHATPADALALGEQTRGTRTVGDTKTILYPAQFWAHKNHVGLLKALAILAERHGLRPRLKLTGTDVGNRAHIDAWAARLGLTDQVEFLGFVSRRDLLELYGHVDALIYPSTFGPENLPPLEAFALACPVAAAKVPGAEEQLGDAALLFDPHDHSQMADAIRTVVYDDATRAALVAKGRIRARRWTNVHVADGILAWLDRFAPLRDLWT